MDFKDLLSEQAELEKRRADLLAELSEIDKHRTETEFCLTNLAQKQVIEILEPLSYTSKVSVWEQLIESVTYTITDDELIVEVQTLDECRLYYTLPFNPSTTKMVF